MKKNLLTDVVLEQSAVVANCRMNRERCLAGGNGYDRELKFHPLDFCKEVVSRHGAAKWLDLCCGTATALAEAAEVIDDQHLQIEIVGIDLVDMFRPTNASCLQLTAASLSDWQPKQRFDLITCIHGLHYIGDKLGLIARCANWLTDHGRFVASLDLNSIVLQDNSSNRGVSSELKRNGFEYSSRTHLLHLRGHREPQFDFQYLGADDEAGPNYTGQPAVNSHYARLESPRY